MKQVDSSGAAPTGSAGPVLAIHELERLCRQIVEYAQDAIILTDREGMIPPWMDWAAAVIGHPTGVADGRPLA